MSGFGRSHPSSSRGASPRLRNGLTGAASEVVRIGVSRTAKCARRSTLASRELSLHELQGPLGRGERRAEEPLTLGPARPTAVLVRPNPSSFGARQHREPAPI